MSLSLKALLPAGQLIRKSVMVSFQTSLVSGWRCGCNYKGVDPKTVQYLADHENSKTTMDIYAKGKYNKPEKLSSVVNAAFGLR